MRVVVVGARGMLGSDVVRSLADHDVVEVDRALWDITDPAAGGAVVAGADVVINTAAFTRVDDAETHEDAALAVNGVGAGNVARAAASAGARLVHLSTDYVFPGDGTSPYPEDAPLHPLGAYGRTKAEGERRVRAAHPAPHIVRTAWLYGGAGPSFPRTMLTLAASRDTVDVVTDQQGQPTWTRDLAGAIRLLIEERAPAGVYHGTNSGATTWFGFARAVFEEAGLDPQRIRPTDSSTFVRPAPRPAYSVLGHAGWAAAGLPEPRPWRDALAEAIAAGEVRAA